MHPKIFELAATRPSFAMNDPTGNRCNVERERFAENLACQADVGEFEVSAAYNINHSCFMVGQKLKGDELRMSMIHEDEWAQFLAPRTRRLMP